jgi:hypothetical protein
MRSRRFSNMHGREKMSALCFGAEGEVLSRFKEAGFAVVWFIVVLASCWTVQFGIQAWDLGRRRDEGDEAVWVGIWRAAPKMI